MFITMQKLTRYHFLFAVVKGWSVSIHNQGAREEKTKEGICKQRKAHMNGSHRQDGCVKFHEAK